MSTPQVFSLSVVANACTGAAALRERLIAAGLDTTTIARLVRTSPLTLARATKSGSTPRDLLIGLAALATVVDQLNDRCVDLALFRNGGAGVGEASLEIAAQSPLAAKMLMRLRQDLGSATEAAQMSLDLSTRAA
jgi:hypothetical protein